MEIKKIFKRSIALDLISKGHKLMYTEPNSDVPRFSVFCFIKTSELLEDLTKLTKHNN